MLEWTASVACEIVSMRGMDAKKGSSAKKSGYLR